MRKPTEKQFRKLLVLRSAIALAPGFREWQPFVKHGWVEGAWGHSTDEISTTGRRKRYPPLKLTPDGYRAVATGLELYGEPDPKPKEKSHA